MEVNLPIEREIKSHPASLATKSAPSALAKAAIDVILGVSCWRTESEISARKANNACRRLVAADRSWRTIKDIGLLAQ